MRAQASVRPPQQARSQATLDRFLEATVTLLAERRFEDAPVAEIARRAHASVGAFYARFPDKDALLAYMNERLFEAGRANWDAFLAPDRWRGHGVAPVVEGVVKHIVGKRRAHRGVLRALALYARSRPAPGFLEHATALNRHVHRRLRALLLERKHEINHPDPERAIGFGLLLVDSATRDAILFDDVVEVPGKARDAVLARELVAAWLAYLGVQGGVRWRRRPRPSKR